MRTLRPVGILAAGGAAAAVAVLVLDPAPTNPGTAAASGPSEGPGAAQVLREWDERREAAWRSADTDALRDLYRPGSGAGRADTALLERWRAAGWQVASLRTQVLAVEVVEESATSLTLRVTDRLAGGEVRRDDVRRALPVSAVSTRTLTLVLGGDGRWRVAAST